MNIHFGDLPTWVASIGTVGALGAALYQISRERQRRLEQESKDQSERHHAQGRLVAAWIGEVDRASSPNFPEGKTAIELLNGSAEPIYEAVAALVYIQGAAPHSIEQWFETEERARREQTQMSAPTALLSIIPPGRWRVWINGSAWGILSGRIGAELAFTDRAGAHWVRRAKGDLKELSTAPFEHFEEHGMFGPPYDYQIPLPVE